ncbi:SDR family NAD(P)-dependent oxidoreductase [bacterium]|nr:SDR family NAD(P)-dependent oxidoreductase [bacterium]
MGVNLLKDKVVIITGASGGIGAALARELAGRKASLILVARREGQLTALKVDLLRNNGNASVSFYPMDITDPAAVDSMIADVHRRFFRIDILINNAAYGINGRFENVPMEEERRIFDTNLFAAVHLMKKVLPIMCQQGGGKIMNIGSVVGHRAMPLMSSYSATKFALKAYTEAIRIEYAKKGVEIMYASPGYTQSNFLEHEKKFGEERRRGVKHAPMPGSVCARKLVDALLKNNRDTILTTFGKTSLIINRFMPGLVDRVLLSRV